jgi:hypothetical protein
MREIDVREKVRELGGTHPPWAEFERIGNLTKLRREPDGRFRPVNYESGLLLYCLVARHRPQRLLEIGTGRGFGSLCMARALTDLGLDGRIVTIDVLDENTRMDWAIDEGTGPRVASLSRKDVWERHFPAAVRERIEQRCGDSPAVLRALRREGLRADFVYIDGDHTFSAAARDFYSSLRLAAPSFRMLLDDYTPFSHLYGVRRLVDSAIAPVFEAELIVTENRWTATPETPRLDQGQVLIDSDHIRRPLDRAYSRHSVATRLWAYRAFPAVFDWLDQARRPAQNARRTTVGSTG